VDKWQIKIGAILIAASIVTYLIHFVIYNDAYDIYFWLIMNIAFVFISVLMVTLIIEAMLTQRDKRAMKKKLNMVIGAFYSEVGTGFIRHISSLDMEADKVRKDLELKTDWPDKEFQEAAERIKSYQYKIAAQRSDLKALRDFLVQKRDFLLGLLENPNLLEHEEFTELLWAVFHLTEELAVRKDLMTIPDPDVNHLTNDAKRAYSLLIREWLSYMKHLKNDYPYLFSLAVRTNPFNLEAAPEVKS
jgi:hypothetical protein